MSLLYGVVFFIILACFAAWASWMAGRATALTWRSYGMAVVYFILLAAAVRFLHHAAASDTFLSVFGYLLDFALVWVVGSIAYRFTRTGQMTRQYPWLYERTSPFTWRDKAHG